MKKVILYLLIIALTAGLIPTNVQAAGSTDALLANLLAAAGQGAAGGAAASTSKDEASFADIQGNWAQASIEQWLKEELITGFQDGTFRPNAEITRAELAALVNRVIGYTETASVSYTDVPSSKWYAAEVARAQAAGYMQGMGDGTFRPDGLVTRQEAAVLIARLLRLDTAASAAEADKFADRGSIATWAREAVGANVAAGTMQGYDGNVFKASQSITRAEMVVILERARAKFVQGDARATMDKAGIYGPETGTAAWDGDLVINAANVTLRNVMVTGDLLLGEKVGEGDVTLDNVIVQGTMTVKGGGKNSVHVLDSTITRIVITKVDGQVRVVVQGSTSVDQVVITTGSTLQVVGGDGASFGTVTISATGEVTLDGDFPNVVVTTAVNLTIAGGTVDTLTLTSQAEGAQVTLDKSTQVQTLNAGASATVAGSGTIGTASVTANGVTIAQTPKNVIVADGVGASVGGSVKQGAGSSSGSSGSSNGGTGSGSGSGTGGSGSGGDGSSGGENPTDPTDPTDPTEPTVPTVSIAVENLSMSGFTMRLGRAVPELTASDILVLNVDGMPALLTSIASIDDGLTFQAKGHLNGGETYSLSIAKPGYVFTGVDTLDVPDTAVINGAMLSPDKTEVSLLFSKTLATLPEADTGLVVTEGGVPIAVQSTVQRANLYQVDLKLDHVADAKLLRVSYEPGIIAATDDTPLAAFDNQAVSDGSTPSGMAAYYRVEGKTASEVAAILKDELSLDADAATDALRVGGFNTNAVVQALYDVYGLADESLITLLLSKDVGVYPLLIAMQAAGILNINGFGKYFGVFDGNAVAFLKALKVLEHEDENGDIVTGYTDEEAALIGASFDRKQLAQALLDVYEVSDERYVEVAPFYRSFAEDVGANLKEVFGDNALQASSVMLAEDVAAGDAGITLRDTYDSTAPDAVITLLTAGYAVSDLIGMLNSAYPDETVRNKAMYLRDAGVDIKAVYESIVRLGGVSSEVMGQLYSAADLTYLFRYYYGWDITSIADYLSMAGFSATEAASAIKDDVPSRYSKDQIIKALLGYSLELGIKYTDPYDYGQVALAVRRLYGDSFASVAQMLVSYGVPTYMTAHEGEITIGDALNAAGFSWDLILKYLVPGSGISATEAVNALFELRHIGYSLDFLAGAPAQMLLDKRGFSKTNWDEEMILLQSSGENTTTGETIDGYTNMEIAKYIIGTYDGSDTVKAAMISSKLVPVYGVAESIGILKELLEPTPAQLLDLLIKSRFCNGNYCSATVVAQALKDSYGLSATLAAQTLRGAATSGYSSVSDIQNGISSSYGIQVGSVQLLKVLRETGFSAADIYRGATSNTTNLKSAGFNATELIQVLSAQNIASGKWPYQLKQLGFTILEVTEALRNSLGGTNSDTVKTNVTQILVAAKTNLEISDSLDEIGAAIGTVFGVDPFGTMASGARESGTPASVAAQQLKASFNVTDPSVMADGLKAAGYDREAVLTAIFQVYANGNFLSSGIIAMMTGVVGSVYPDVAYPIDVIMPALGITTAKQSTEVMSNLGQDIAVTIGLLNRGYGLSPADTTGNLYEAMGYRDKKNVIAAVGDYFDTDGYSLFSSYQRSYGRTANETYVALQYGFGLSDGIEIARYLDAAGYGQVDIINAIRNYYMGDDARADVIAKTIVEIYGNDSVDVIAKALKNLGYVYGSTDLAIKAALPNISQVDRITALLNAPEYLSSIYVLLGQEGPLEDSMINQLHNLGFNVRQTDSLLMTNNNYTLKERVAKIRDLGYPLTDLAKVGGSESAIGSVMYELGYSVEDTALIMTLMGLAKTGKLMVYLYDAGWHEPVDIIRGSASVGMTRLWLFGEMRKIALTDLGKRYTWTPAVIARAIAEGSDLTMVELAQSVIKYYNYNNGIVLRMDMFDALYAVKDYALEGMREAADGSEGDFLSMLTEIGDSVAFKALHDGGLDENEAARIMKSKGWDWISSTIQLQQAGYSSGEIFDALWDVYRNELGLLILNLMSFVAPLAELGLAEQLSNYAKVAKFVMSKAMNYGALHVGDL
ncbi:S-layer homology domain-containing protein [Cohnella fermenti]|uniref:S-layer homology domain-containing protein n=1 Tax=Cohnella fermenti TaxID=2565925 RepID=UPI001454D621|nr:S-layer homology domain-containing protein [Cohnella fermenti]